MQLFYICFLSAILRWSLLPTSPHSTSPSLLTLSLSLLHSLLRHKLHPPTPDINHASFNEKLTSLLDHVIETECESCPPSSGAELCAALLEVYEGSEVKLMRQKGCGLGAGLVSKVLCVLLASSQSAKQTALKGLCFLSVCDFQQHSVFPCLLFVVCCLFVCLLFV